MNKLLLFVIAIFLNCSPGNQSKQDSPSNIPEEFEISISPEYPFGVHFIINEKGGNKFELMTTIELKDGDFIISPFSTDGFYGKVDFSFEKRTGISLDSDFLENPIFKEEMDTIINKPVRFVRETVNYFHSFQVDTKKDFDVNGLIWLVLEPSCVPYEVDFMISQKEDKVTAKKTAIRNVLPRKRNIESEK